MNWIGWCTARGCFEGKREGAWWEKAAGVGLVLIQMISQQFTNAKSDLLFHVFGHFLVLGFAISWS